MSFKNRLKGMQDNWDAGKEKAQGLPDGKYKFQVQNVEVVESKAEKMQVHWEMLILEGEIAGETHHEYQQLETEWGPVFAMQFIEQLGFQIPGKIEDLEESLAEVNEGGPIFMGTLETAEGYQNLSINKLVAGNAEKVEPPSMSGAASSEAEADPWQVGDRVEVTYDEGTFPGEIQGLYDEKVSVKFDDGSSEDVEYDDLVMIEDEAQAEAPADEAPAEDAQPEGWNVGDRCSVDTDDGNFTGAVKEINADAGEITVHFDDDTDGTFDEEDILAEEGEPENEEDVKKLEQLKAVALTMEIPLTEDDTLESVTEKLTASEWDRTQFMPNEIELLESIGVKLVTPQPKKPTRTKTAKKPSGTKSKTVKKKTASKPKGKSKTSSSKTKGKSKPKSAKGKTRSKGGRSKTKK